MRGYRQWLNGVRRRAAARSWLWREIERVVSSVAKARVARVMRLRVARVAAIIAAATILAAMIGVVARLTGSVAQAEQGAQAGAPLSGAPSGTAHSTASSVTP
jgi:hypothetical protein